MDLVICFKIYKSALKPPHDDNVYPNCREPAEDDLVMMDPSVPPLSGFQSAPTRVRETVKRVGSNHGRIESSLYKWKMIDSPLCPVCHSEPLTADHTVFGYPVIRIIRGYN